MSFIVIWRFYVQNQTLHFLYTDSQIVFLAVCLYKFCLIFVSANLLNIKSIILNVLLLRISQNKIIDLMVAETHSLSDFMA